MIRLGDALTLPDAGVGGPPVKALVVYNSNQRCCSGSQRGTTWPGSRRPVHGGARAFPDGHGRLGGLCAAGDDGSSTGTFCLAYGHHYATLNRPAIAPIGRALPNTEIFRRLARAMGLTQDWFCDDDLTLIRQALDTNAEKMRGVTFEALMEKGW